MLSQLYILRIPVYRVKGALHAPGGYRGCEKLSTGGRKLWITSKVFSGFSQIGNRGLTRGYTC